MSSFLTGSFFLFIIALTGWAITTYLVKENSQMLIKNELKNLFEICKMFFISLKSLIVILAKESFSSDSNKTKPTESNKLNEHPLNLFDSVKEVQSPSLEAQPEEDHDSALSSFSPEEVEAIEEEEERVA